MRILCLLLVFLPLSLLAQREAKRDSLLRLAAGATTDTARVWALMETGKLYLLVAPDSALKYLNEALLLAEKTGFERGIARCRINSSFAYNNIANYSASIEACERAIPICMAKGMKKELVAAYNNMGNAWDYQGNRWKAIESFTQALKYIEGANLPPTFPITVRNNIARQYNDVRLYTKAMEYCEASLKASMALGDSAIVASTLHVMAATARFLGQDALALHCFKRVERIARDIDDPTLLVFALSNLASMTWDESPERATALAQESLQLAKQAEDFFGEVSALESLAHFAIRKQQFDKARQYALLALQKAQTAGMNDEVANCYLILSDVSLAFRDVKAFRTYRDHFFAMNDTLANQHLVMATQELETRYESEKKAQQIATLEREKELQSLRLRQKNGLIGGLAALSGLIALAGLLTVRNLRQRRSLAEQALKIQQQQNLQLKQEQQLNVADAILRGQEDERSRLARDLHDGLGGMLSGVKQSLNGIKGQQIMNDTNLTALSQVIYDLDRSINELRHIARNMMPEALVRFGLKDALHDYCDHLAATSTLQVHFQAFGLEKRLPQQVEVILFRIAQELLNNIVKHAGATQVLVQLMESDGRVSLTVEDNGKGFDPETLQKAPGVGWLNIKSRVEYLNGRMDLNTAPGRGASIHVECQI